MEVNSYPSKKIEKPAIIITSLGRTGTKFFQVLLGNLLPESISLHEPDVLNYFQYEGALERYKQVRKQIEEVGLGNLVLRKSLGNWNLLKVSDDRFVGSSDYSSAIKKLYAQRSAFIRKLNGSPYIESNIGYYGLLDTLGKVFDQYRALYIVRDGRSWIQSHMNWGQMYGKNRIQRIYAHTWPTAHDLGEMSRGSWESMSRFGKLCWAWTRLNEFALSTIGNKSTIRYVRFEDIFLSEGRYSNLEDAIEFILSFDDPLPYDKGSIVGWLEKKIHSSESAFPEFQNWSKDQKDHFHRICDPLMNRLGYL